MKTQLQWITAILITAAFILAPVIGISGQGREKMMLDGGKKGPVPFKHHLHQATVGDCMICHKSFPQKKGALSQAIAAGTLKAKQVMNKSCIKCHRAKKKAGQPHGPTSCKACHKK